MNRMFNDKIRPTLLFILFFTSGLNGMNTDNKTIQANLSLGLAYPQIPLSQFRPPIGITGTIGLGWRFHDKWAFCGNGNALKTFSLGTITGKNATLKFDAFWFAGNVQYTLTNDFHKKNILSLGMGGYKLNRQLDDDIDNVKTPGIGLGFINHTHHEKFRGIFEIKWHLLFKPEDNPQILTVTYGILI
ncbi:hypothetical protein JW835_06780 [bacterium]|nr:hypothetical protein [bacterium]